MPDDLLAFLAAVHDADEQAAREAADAARSAPWHVPPPPEPDEAGLDGDHPMIHTADDDFIFHLGDGYVGRGVAHHIARHDPQSVLARVEAERALVAIHSDDDGLCFSCTAGFGPISGTAGVPWPCPTLRALAWGYRHREGWQESWRPDGVEVEA